MAAGTGLRLGLSSCFFHADPKRALFKGKTLTYVESDLARWLLGTGALVYPIPAWSLDGAVGPADFAADLDGLVLHGGSDVAPESYGATPERPEWSGDRVRDVYELALLRAFMDARKPVLGVCRGLQLINVGLGGTLLQDIATHVPNARVHRDWDIYEHNVHDVSFAKNGELFSLFGSATGRICSVHHQAIDRLGADLVVEARCPDDGIVEAVRYTGPGWVRAVQWHPEWHDPADRSLLDGGPLLRAFLTAARATRVTASPSPPDDTTPGAPPND